MPEEVEAVLLGLAENLDLEREGWARLVEGAAAVLASSGLAPREEFERLLHPVRVAKDAETRKRAILDFTKSLSESVF